MQICDHLIYTTAENGSNLGYQIIAKSSGITYDLIQELDGYFYPADIDPTKFTKSSSLLFLKNNKIAYITVKNIGVSFDGRDDAIYSHIIILGKKQFEAINYDARILSDYFIEDLTKKGEIEKIRINEESMEINWDFFEKIPRNLLELIFDNIFSDKKIILLKLEQENFIFELISILPQSLKQMSYSNVVFEPNQQPQYDIMQVPHNQNISIKDYTTINVNELFTFYTNDQDLLLERSVKRLTEILKSKNIISLKFIHNEFNEIVDIDNKIKLKLATYYEQIYKETNKDKCTKFAYDILELLINCENETKIKYLDKIKEWISKKDYKKYLGPVKIEYAMNILKNQQYTYKNIKQRFDELNKHDPNYANELFQKLIKEDLEKIKEQGSQIIIEFQHEYNKIVIPNFIKNESLHSCILEIFTDKITLSDVYKQSLFKDIIEKSIDSQVELTTKLLEKSVFNISEKYDTSNYINILELILQNKKFLKEISIDQLYNIVNEKYLEIIHIIKYSNSLNIFGMRNYIRKDIKEIIKIFLKILEYASDNKISNDIDKINIQKEKLQKLLNTDKM